MGAEPRAVSDVEEDDEGEDQEGVGQDRVGEEDPEPRAQAERNPHRGEADAQRYKRPPGIIRTPRCARRNPPRTPQEILKTSTMNCSAETAIEPTLSSMRTDAP